MLSHFINNLCVPVKSIMWLCDFCINPHYFIDCFISVKSTLHSGDKAYLVMVSIHFYVWLDLVCQYFVERICIYKKYLCAVFLGCFWLSYQRIMAPRSKLESVFPVGLERGGIKEELLNYWCYCPWIFFWKNSLVKLCMWVWAFHYEK